jgi:hypothetical protein
MRRFCIERGRHAPANLYGAIEFDAHVVRFQIDVDEHAPFSSIAASRLERAFSIEANKRAKF